MDTGARYSGSKDRCDKAASRTGVLPLSALVVLVLQGACDPATREEVATSRSVASATANEAPSSARPLMIEFTRDYCLPCQIMAPTIAELRGTYGDRVDVAEVNTDREKNERFAVFFAIESVPTQVFVDAAGRIVHRHDGIATAQELKATLQKQGWIP